MVILRILRLGRLHESRSDFSSNDGNSFAQKLRAGGRDEQTIAMGEPQKPMERTTLVSTR